MRTLRRSVLARLSLGLSLVVSSDGINSKSYAGHRNERGESDAKQTTRARLRYSRERYFAGGVEIREVPGVRAGDGECAAGIDAGPVEEVERASDLGGRVYVCSEGEFE